MIQKEHLSFDPQKNSVKLFYNKQIVVFNAYNCPSRHKFNMFKQRIVNSSPAELDNINDIYGLANRFEVRGTGGESYTIHKTIAY